MTRRGFVFGLIEVERTGNDRVDVVYSLEDLSGLDQEVSLEFSLLDNQNTGQRITHTCR